MRIGLLSAPSNLGLRPPAPASVPGCVKAPEALREAGLHRRLAGSGAEERGVILPGRYADDAAPGSLRNPLAIIEHARRLVARIDLLRAGGLAPLVPGGDCSILVAAGLSLRRAPGRYGLVHLDGHADFRDPRNSDQCASLAGEDPAAVGRHWPAIADIDGLSPYFFPVDTAHAGCRDDDQELQQATAVLGAVLPASQIRRRGVQRAAPAAARSWLRVRQRHRAGHKVKKEQASWSFHSGCAPGAAAAPGRPVREWRDCSL